LTQSVTYHHAPTFGFRCTKTADFSCNGAHVHRYGFNGKEKEDGINIDNYDFGARIYDGRVGRWLSVDPIASKYPGYSPFVFAFSNPLCVVDPGGDENIIIVGGQNDKTAGNKLMFAHQAITKVASYQSRGDKSTTVVMFSMGYTKNQIDAIKKSVTKYGGNLVLVSSSDELFNYINSKSTTQKLVSSQRNSDKVQDVDIFAHGVVGSIQPGYEFGQDVVNKTKITKENIKNIDPKAFDQASACINSYACRTGLGDASIDGFAFPWEDGDPENSLAQSIADHTGVRTYAYQRRTDYSSTLGSSWDRMKHRFGQSEELEKALKTRKTIDGAAFQPEGALHGVDAGSTPVGVSSERIRFEPKEK